MDLSKIICGVKYSGFINAVLQNIVRQKDNLSSSNWDIKNNYPKWMLNSWEKQYGKIGSTSILECILAFFRNIRIERKEIYFY